MREVVHRRRADRHRHPVGGSAKGGQYARETFPGTATPPPP